MRIDFNAGTQAAPETSPSRSQTATAARAAEGPGIGEDQAQLSGARAQVQTLAAQASQMPEVRQERVQALRQAVAAGQYRPSPEKVAAAIVTHMIRGSVA